MTVPRLQRAPWSGSQVARLVARQADPRRHPYTCADHSQGAPLVPTKMGWYCPEPGCSYTQDWARGADLRAAP